jgi:hypothetical protein
VRRCLRLPWCLQMATNTTATAVHYLDDVESGQEGFFITLLKLRWRAARGDYASLSPRPPAEKSSDSLQCSVGRLLDTTENLRKGTQEQSALISQLGQQISHVTLHAKALKHDIDDLKRLNAEFKKDMACHKSRLSELRQKAELHQKGVKVETLLGQTKAVFWGLVKDMVIQGECRAYMDPTNLREIGELLTAEQLHRWSKFEQAISPFLTTEELYLADDQLRSMAFGYVPSLALEHTSAATEGRLHSWAAELIWEPELLGPVKKFISLLASFSTEDKPLLPDLTYHNKLAPQEAGTTIDN